MTRPIVRRIRSVRAARRARTHALVLVHWRRDVERGVRIGDSAQTVGLPHRYSRNAQWVLVHLFRWDENRQVKLLRSELESGEFDQRLSDEGHR